jgi:hypothetical protein
MDLKSRGRQGRSFIQRAVEQVSTRTSGVSVSKSNIEDDDLLKKVDALFSTQDLLFERLHSEPKFSKTYLKIKKAAKHRAELIKKSPHVLRGAAVVGVVLACGGVFQLFHTKKAPSVATTGKVISQVAGATDTTSDKTIKSIDTSVKPDFTLLLPSGKRSDQVSFAKVSPEGNDAVYAFVDKLDGYEIKVSEQKVPKQFDYNRDVELERVAKNFQATNVIQIDSTKVYHGYSEKQKVQSLVFIKKDRLVFISSPTKLSDDTWTGYVLDLK